MDPQKTQPLAFLLPLWCIGEDYPLFNVGKIEPSGDLAGRPKCGARSRQKGGQPCAAFVVRGRKRCRMHGGLSTGPRTPEGLERSRRARWKHGRYSREAIEARRLANQETWEQAKARFAREERRRDSRQAREVREITRQLNRLLGRPR